MKDCGTNRGHVFNTKTKECVAYTLPKFFNLNENEETQNDKLPWKDGYEIFQKWDGWLGNLYRHDGKFKIATRGSFKSDGAIWATQWLQDHIDLSYLDDNLTLVFEIVSPITKIIVNYETQGLVLLTAFNRHTGEELSWPDVKLLARKFGFEIPKAYTNLNECLDLLRSEPGDELEGFVIKFKNGTRIKIKSEDYFRISRLIKSLSPKNIWETMSNGKIDTNKFEDLNLSPDLYKKALSTASDLEEQYLYTSTNIKYEFLQIMTSEPETRKDFALLVNKENCAYKSAMFMCFDNQYERLADYIKKLIRPIGNILESKRGG